MTPDFLSDVERDARSDVKVMDRDDDDDDDDDVDGVNDLDDDDDDNGDRQLASTSYCSTR